MENYSHFSTLGIRKHNYNFVKIISLKSDGYTLTLQKRLFYNAKEPVLSCKTGSFGMQNNGCCKVLIMSLLCDKGMFEKYLHFCHSFCAYEIGVQICLHPFLL